MLRGTDPFFPPPSARCQYGDDMERPSRCSDLASPSKSRKSQNWKMTYPPLRLMGAVVNSGKPVTLTCDSLLYNASSQTTIDIEHSTETTMSSRSHGAWTIYDMGLTSETPAYPYLSTLRDAIPSGGHGGNQLGRMSLCDDHYPPPEKDSNIVAM